MSNERGRRIDGWKEIAQYLDRSVRTVQKWERDKGLPICRTKGEKPRVHAYAAELDGWWQASSERKPIWWKLCLGAVLILLVVSTLTQLAQKGSGPPNSWTVDSDTFRVFDERNRWLWDYQVPGVALEPRILLEDIDADGTLEVLFDFVPDLKETFRGRLICFDAEGEIEWSFDYRAHKEYRGRPFDDRYAGYGLTTVSVGGQRYVLLLMGHQHYFPTRVVLLEASTGQIVSEYWHPGRLNYLLFDFDGDGEPELLLGGHNNPNEGLGHAGMAVLDIPFNCRSRDLPDYFPVEFTGGCEETYVLFPRVDVSDALAVVPHVQEMRLDSRGRIVANVAFDEGNGRIEYFFSNSLELLEVSPADGLATAHQALVADGLLDHELTEDERRSWEHVLKLPAAPDGNHPIIPSLFQNQAKSGKGSH